MKRYGLSWILVLLSVTLAAATANAQWVKDGVPVGSADNMQYGPRIASNGANGAIVVWVDYRSGADYDIYGNVVDAAGNVLGGSGGMPVCATSSIQYDARVVLDGSGGVIVVWLDNRNGDSEIYAQRVDTTGIVWTTDGIEICPGADSDAGIRVVPDGGGGAIIAWGRIR